VLQFALTAKSRQHLGHKRAARLVTTASCSAACSLVLSGKFVIASVPKRGHSAKLKARTVKVSRLLVTQVTAGKRVKLTIKLSPRMRKLLAAALAQHRRLTLKITGVASVAGMTPATSVVTIRVIL
jgi:hypothetical protein